MVTNLLPSSDHTQKMPILTILPWILCAGALVFAFYEMYTVRAVSANAEKSCQVVSLRGGGNFTYINPLLACEVATEQNFHELSDVRKMIEKYIEAQKKSGALTKASVYFRDYTKGEWLTIGGNEHYAPASLLKVPLMIAYMKIARTDHTLMAKKLTRTEPRDFNEGVNFKPTNSIKLGESHTIEELIHSIIINSDNNALYLLNQNIDQQILNEVYTDLGLSIPTSATPESVDFITAKEYSYFFRILYNATYIGRRSSEEALGLLAQTDFKNGIIQGVPEGTKVAHKFGEREVSDVTPPVRELHDCGIIYYPDHPYLLCIMTQGSNYNDLSKTIGDISREVFNTEKNLYQK